MYASQPLRLAATTSWAALPSLRAESFSVLNRTGSNLLISRTDQTDDTTKRNTLSDGQGSTYRLNGNLSEFSIKGAAADGVEIIAEPTA